LKASHLCCEEEEGQQEEFLVQFHISNESTVQSTIVKFKNQEGDLIQTFVATKITNENGTCLHGVGRTTKIVNGDAYLIIRVNKNALQNGEYQVSTQLKDSVGNYSNEQTVVLEYQFLKK
jgi:hypothetical protein